MARDENWLALRLFFQPFRDLAKQATAWSAEGRRCAVAIRAISEADNFQFGRREISRLQLSVDKLS